MTATPPPREGLPGAWDAVVGPGASGWEDAGTLGCMILGAIAAPILLGRGRPRSGPVERGIAAAVGGELAAGAWSTETPSSKRWYHHPASSRLGRVGYAAMQVHPFVVEVSSRRFDLRSAALAYGSLVAGAAILEMTPTERRRTRAMAVYTGWLAGNAIVAPPPSGYAWLPPLLGYKVLVGHGTPSGPLSRLRRRRR